MGKNPWISDMHWKRDGQQTRSQRTQESLLDAAEVLFTEKGAEATSVADVAEQANCSVGAVYHHFRDKKALMYALFDRMSTEFERVTREGVDPARWEGATIADILRGYIEASLLMGRVRPGFKRSGLEASQSDPELKAHFAELLGNLYKGLGELLMARQDEIGHPYPDLAVPFVVDQVSSILRGRLDQVIRRSQLTQCTDEAFTRETLRMASDYLQLKGAPETEAES